MSDWRVLATVREQNLKHIETWLDQAVLKKLPLRTITVGALNQEELSVVAAEVLRLRPLLAQSGELDVVLSRPFFLDAIAGLAGDSSSHQLPATEVELLKLWWTLGGSDRSDFSAAQHRRNVLLDLAQRSSTGTECSHRDPKPRSRPAGRAKDGRGILRDKELGHSVEFTHDIYEEWALCELLIGEQDRLAAYLHDVGQPQILVRPTQLLGAYVLETTGSTETWKTLLEKTGESSLRPVWQRAILTSCFQSTRTAELLSKLSADLMQGGWRTASKAIARHQHARSHPQPAFPQRAACSGLRSGGAGATCESRGTAKAAHLGSVPHWLVPQIGNLQPNLIPALLPVLTTWQNNYAGQRVRHCRQIGALSYSWLLEIEDAIHPASWKDRKHPLASISAIMMNRRSRKRFVPFFDHRRAMCQTLLQAIYVRRQATRETGNISEKTLFRTAGLLCGIFL